MRKLFSEYNQRANWRKLWVYLAEAESKYGLISREEVADLKQKMRLIDIERAHEIEKQIKHDVMAEIRTYAEQAKTGGGKIHLGATSADIEDNADVIRIKQALNLVLTRLVNCLSSTIKMISQYSDLACMGWTHLQPAEPTTLGYRFASYTQDLILDIHFIEHVLTETKGKGFKGAVGTSSSYKNLLAGKAEPRVIEEAVMEKVKLESFPVSTQTYPRKVDYMILAALAGIAQSAQKFAFDVRLLQSPMFGELLESMGEEQVGSSTMAFKRNPVKSERICSLARYVSVLPTVGFTNAANALLERTLDDSASRRIIIPECFLAVDEVLILYNSIATEIKVYPKMIRRNLERFGVFSATERLLVALAAKGEDRQKMHEKIRVHSFKAWERVMEGEENPLANLLKKDHAITRRLSPREVERLLDPSDYIGDVTDRCKRFLSDVAEPLLMKYKARLGRKESSAVF